MKTTQPSQQSQPVQPRASGPRHEMSTVLREPRVVSTIHFLVHPAMAELQREAEARGWTGRGFTALSIAWLEVRWTTDGWATTHTVSSTDVPCPVVDGTIHLSGCAPGTEVEFALRVGLACHAPHDSSFPREVGEVWLNNASQNYRQTTR